MNRAAAIDLVCALERTRAQEARAFVMVTVDQQTGQVAHATGPFAEAEQALAEAGRDDTDWRRHNPDDRDGFSYHVVPLWEPS